MTPSEIDRFALDSATLKNWTREDGRHANWPVVYVLDGVGQGRAGERSVYVGETRSAAARLRQHLASPAKKTLTRAHVVVDPTFNKSVCLDLESFLIRLLAGDGQYAVLNRNDGIVDSDYYERARYGEAFDGVFEELLAEGVFTRSIPEIENSDLFKLSPFKALTRDQAAVAADILDGLTEDLRSGIASTIVVQGEPGTGKTILAIYLLKLLADVAAFARRSERARAAGGERGLEEAVDGDTLFSDYFLPGYREPLQSLRVGLVVPQQSLRESIRKVFRRTPGLTADMVVTPFDVGADERRYDLLVVDESHRLNQRANQASAAQNTRFRVITERLFGEDDPSKTQLDWIRAQSDHQILLLDAEQAVRPADLPREVVDALLHAADNGHRRYRLASQMRVRAGADYVGYVRRVLDPMSESVPTRPDLGEYDLRFFENLGDMRREIRRREAESGLARLVAGYAWPWVSKGGTGRYDIEIDGVLLRWNSTQKDWIASAGSLEEVGSIHTVQGYDLNYAGVIIGPDLRWDARARRLALDRSSYHDKKGKENNPRLGRKYTDAELLQFVTNIYGVLLTRGMLGTYVYVCDPVLREHLRAAFRAEP